jgi:MtfA peptidase
MVLPEIGEPLNLAFCTMASIIHKIVRRLFRKVKPLSAEILPAEEVLLLKEVEGYAAIISACIPYFNQLTSKEKERFIKRVYFFKSCKSFHYIGLEEKPEMAVLISAAAVQLTFGLRKYRLTYFKDINVLADAYAIPDYPGLYIGHVSPEGIYLSWKHFLEGYKNDTDNVNVAIHEMAHALEYENFISETGIDWDFRMDFEKFQEVTGPLFVHVLLGKPSYLRGYAYTNLREFWAVSVEAFFENPQALKDHMPHLYRIISEVLNQDPLQLHKIIPLPMRK